MIAIRYEAIISFFTVRETTLLLLTTQGSVTDTTFRPPLRAPPTARKRK